MTITYEEVILLCNKYLKAIIPGSTGHHPIFNGIEGGVALTKRLYKVLRRVSGFLCLGRLFQGQPNEAALCI